MVRRRIAFGRFKADALVRVVAERLILRGTAATQVDCAIFIGLALLRDRVAARPLQIDSADDHVRAVGGRYNANTCHFLHLHSCRWLAGCMSSVASEMPCNPDRFHFFGE